MRRIRLSGPEEVASLLRSVADGVGTGRVQLGGEGYACSARISAVVEVPEDSQGPVTAITMLVHFGEQAERRPGQVVEQELTHPGG